MYVRRLGQGAPVVFLHGSPTPAEILAPLAEAIADQRTALLVHSPGYGHSPPLPPSADGPSLLSLQAALEQALLQEGVYEADFVGYSLGAYQALALALRGTIRVRRIACLAGLATLSTAERQGLLSLVPAIRAGVDLSAAMIQRMVSPGFAAQHPEAAASTASWAGATTPGNLADEVEALAAGADLCPRLASLACPLLLRVGELDVAAPAAHSQQIASAAPHATLQIVPGVGHALLLEDRPGTTAAVRDFLLASAAS